MVTLQRGFNHVYKEAQKEVKICSITNLLSNKKVTNQISKAIGNKIKEVIRIKPQNKSDIMIGIIFTY